MKSLTPLDRAETPLQVLLRRPERFCDQIINSFTAHIAILDELGMIIAINRAWREFAEANAPAVAKVCEGANYLKVCDKASGSQAEDAAAVADGIRSVLRGEEREFTLEYHCHGPQENRWFTVRVTSFLANGVTRAIVAHENVTRRKQAEMALQEMLKELATEEARLRTLVHTIPDLVWLKDVDGVFLLCNPMFERLLGAGEADIVGKTDYDLVDRELADFFRENDRKAMAAGEPSINEEWLTFAADGRRALCETIKTPMRDAEGQIIGVLGIARDITARKQAEEKLKQTLADLARSNEELEQFAYVASHDLQEPLRMVSSYTQLLAKRYQGKLDTDAVEFIAFAVDGARRMQGLINDLLAYSRVGTRGKKPEPTDSSAALDQALTNLRAAIEETGATVTREPLPTVMADKGQLAQLFQNLVGNAIKYHGQEAPCIHVSAERKGGEVVFAVRDNGIGIEPKYFERIFAVFQRLHTREEYPGTGIGLAICRKIVERHGGRIWVESQLGTGSTFYFTVPSEE